MKHKIFLRIAKTKKGTQVSATTRPNYDALQKPKTYNKPAVTFPTLAFAVELDIPDELFKQAESVAATINLKKQNAVITGTVIQPAPAT